MSSQRGNTKRTRASKHQNTFKYQHNKSSKRTKEILGSPIEGVCDKCFKVLEWKKDYRKYKPLTVPKKWFTRISVLLLMAWMRKLLFFDAPRTLVLVSICSQFCNPHLRLK